MNVTQQCLSISFTDIKHTVRTRLNSQCGHIIIGHTNRRAHRPLGRGHIDGDNPLVIGNRPRHRIGSEPLFHAIIPIPVIRWFSLRLDKRFGVGGACAGYFRGQIVFCNHFGIDAAVAKMCGILDIRFGISEPFGGFDDLGKDFQRHVMAEQPLCIDGHHRRIFARLDDKIAVCSLFF